MIFRDVSLVREVWGTGVEKFGYFPVRNNSTLSLLKMKSLANAFTRFSNNSEAKQMKQSKKVRN
ncbi:hypothetical protein [Aestuariibaculum sediminum]|uniref:Uncharacterized protein n=1 Tax=Aestuariibaculum sediminum TaxID=2770637 RepID=A0A8J6Q884_9FLAO|nr:hypothetical protein [Aestuariibaculum sediminum]MBD0831312.1 hypothetical protein [Aestuariibaculum sediminum]